MFCMLLICDKIENYLKLHMIYGNSKKQKQLFTFEVRALQSFNNWVVIISVLFPSAAVEEQCVLLV